MTTDYIPLSEYGKMFPFMVYENVLALRVSLETGLRIGDVVSLPASALVGNKLTYTAQKTGKTGVCSLSVDLARTLRKITGNRFIFESESKCGHRTRQTVWRDVKKAAQLAGVTGNVAPHSARKTHAVQTFKTRGFSAAQRELQHDNPSTTMLYVFSQAISDYRQEEIASFSENQLDILAEKIAERVVDKLVKYREVSTI